MPIYDDPASPIGKSIPLIPTDISRLRKGAPDNFVADKAYNLDPQFRSLADHYLNPEINSQLDEQARTKLPTMLLNMHYFGKPVLEQTDDLGSVLSQPSVPNRGIVSRFAQSFGTQSERARAKEQEIAEGRSGFSIGDLPGDLADVAGGALPLAGTLVGGGVGAIMWAPAGGVGAIPGSVIGAGVGAGIGESGRQAIGRMLGMRGGETTGQELGSIGTEAVAGAASEVIGLGIGKVLSTVGKTVPMQSIKKAIADRLPTKMINSLIKPGKNEFKFGKNPGQAIVDEGIVASNIDDLLAKVGGRLGEIGQEIERVITAASVKNPAQIDMKPIILGAFDDAINTAKKFPRQNEGMLKALEAVKNDLLDVYGNTQVPIGVWDAKKAVGGLIKWDATDPFRGEKNQALWKIFDGLKNALNKEIKGLDVLNGRYSELVAAKTAIARRSDVLARSNVLGNMAPLVVGAGAGGSELLRTGDVGSAAKVGAAAAIGTKFLGSTAPKTFMAQVFKKIPNFVSSFGKLQPLEKAAIFEYVKSLMAEEPQQVSPTQEQ